MTIKSLLTLVFLVPALAFATGKDKDNKKKAEDYGKEYYNWHHADPKKDKKVGISTTRAYTKAFKKQTPSKKIVVAVIDGGVDPQHEDLKDRMWVNKKEIAANGIDDDNNGYIDDIYGWNFLGNADGKSINEEALEVTRIYRELNEKFRNIKPDNISDADKKDYELYKQTKDHVDHDLKEAKELIAQIQQLKMALSMINPAIEELVGKKDYTLEDVQALKSDDADVKQLIAFKIELMKQKVDEAALAGAEDHYRTSIDYGLNPEFNPRKEIIGDNPNDISDRNYGNADVKGPDASHGTFVAGIIGAVRGNGIGIDGIADNIEIMALRAVPKGDEYDKDIALAVYYAVDNGAQVINMSFGKAYSPQKKFVDAALKYAEEHGVLVVNAAGNDHVNVDTDFHYPIDRLDSGHNLTNMITVGASSMKNSNELTGSFSNYGKQHVDLFAPGVDIVSLAPDNQYDMSDGTSAASPVVAGVAALIWSYYPSLTAQELKSILMDSAYNLGSKTVNQPSDAETAPQVKFDSLSVTGGVVNVYSAAKLAKKRS